MVEMGHAYETLVEAEHSNLDALRSATGRPLQGLFEWVERQLAEGVSSNRPVSEATELYTASREPPTDHCQLMTDNRGVVCNLRLA